MAAGGVPVLPFFEHYDGLPTLLSEWSRYIREWVRVFYATLFVEEDRQFIDFMFQQRHYRLTRARLATLLGVRIAEEPHYLHYQAYGNTVPPHRPHETPFPSDKEVSVLFQQPFLSGTPRTPDRLTPVAQTIHLALRKSLLFRIGYNEGITALQQWLLLYIMTGREFDLVDFFICELEDVIMDGMAVHRRHPFAH